MGPDIGERDDRGGKGLYNDLINVHAQSILKNIGKKTLNHSHRY